MDPASLPSYHAWAALRPALGFLLLLPIIAGMLIAGVQAWLKRRAARRVHGASQRSMRRRPAGRPVACWPERRATVPLPRDRRPWRSHRR